MNSTAPITSYPLASIQGAMLVNHLRAPRSGVDVVQMVCTMPERVDVDALRAAWELVTARHDALRTAFRWEDVPAPRQEVFDWAPVEVTVVDWSDASTADRDARWSALMAEDRARGFDLRRLPLQRVTLVRFGETSWRLMWTFHHILIDGRAFAMVLREVFAAYDAAGRGEPAPAPVERRSYREFAEWYAARDFSAAEGFWRERLRGIPGPTPLPAAFHATNDSRTGRGLHERILDAASTASLERLAKANGLTMNTVVQAAWALLLSRHSGETDVVFGATRACRKGTIPGSDDVVGLFINTLPVRARVHPDQSLVDLLAELRRTWRDLFEVEHTPTQLIQKWSDVGPTTPLFESQIVFENLPLDRTLQADGGPMAARGFHLYGGTNFPLTGLIFGGERLSLEIENDRSRIDDATANRLVDHLATILASMAARPDAKVGELAMLPARERELVVTTWNHTAEPHADATLVELIAEQTTRTPSAIAVEDDRRALSFAELDGAATALAQRLRGLGVGPNTLVGISAERSVELVVGLVGVLKAGGAYVPLDPDYPSDRLSFMLADAGVPVLLAQGSLVAGLAPRGTTVLSLDDVATGSPDASLPALPMPSPDDAAYMIYTSGSTGRPKGALNAHRGIVNRLRWMQREYDLGPGDVVLQKTPFSFDVSVWEFFWPLLTGAKLVMARPGGQRDTAYLVEVMTSRGVTVCHFVPSMLRAFLADARSAGCTTLRDVMASGEALPPDVVAEFNRRLPRARLHNLYGPTECAVDVTYWACPQSAEPLPVVPIGRPVSNTQMYVLDGRGEPTPIGVPGELYIAGVQVGLGYHNRPELTAERFVPDPFSGAPNARMYRTGDKARWRPDGTLEYLGRLDFQVKIRGFRIELGEIEATLAKHPRVREAVVVARDEAAGERRLVAYLVAATDGATPAISELREHLLNTLPDYMVPAAFVWLPALPLSSNGKVDRRALPAPELEREALSRAYVAPRTPTERTLAGIWETVLRVDRVGVEDNFFELGGDSLLTVQIVARAAAAGIRVTLMQVMRHPTVEALSRVAESARPVDGLSQDDVIGDVALTPMQHWFFENQPDGAHHWNQAFLFTVPATLDARALSEATTAVIGQHDSLRLRFERAGGGWRQRCVAADSETLVEEIDLGGLSAAQRAETLARECSRLQASLDLATGPLIRVGLFRNDAGEPGRMLIAVHHLAIDGVSWRILREDLETAYRQRAKAQPIALPSRTTPFGRWANHLAAPSTREELRDEIGYWEETASAACLRVPRDLAANEPGRAAQSETLVARLGEAETRTLLQSVPRAYNTQINDALLAAFADALGAWLGTGDVVVNLEGHGREDVGAVADLSRTLGWFTTLFPVRLRLGATDVGARLKETKERLRAVPRRGIGYGVLRYLDGVETLRAQSAPDLVFNYLGQFDQVLAGSKLFGFAPESTGSWYGAQTARPHLLEVNCLVIDDALELRWSYSVAAHRRETIARVADAYVAALRAIIAHCTAPNVGGYTPSDFPLAGLDQGTLDRVAAGRRDIEDIYPVVPMQRLFLGFADLATDPGFEQWRYRLRGAVDLAALRAAWELVVSRHAILRTAFVSDGLSQPLQVVSRNVALPWAEHDWREVPEPEQTRRMAELLAADRASGFAFDRAPLMRIAVVRLADDVAELVWSNHHLLLDRWSWPLILLELARAYPAIAARREPALEPAPRYGDFVGWQMARPLDAAREFWTRHFAGFRPPPRFAVTRPDATDEPAEVTVALTAAETDAVNALARAQHVAVNTIVEAGWALWLARLGRHDDVSFGLAVAGRDGAVRGIERMVGLTISNLPVRIRVDGTAPVGAWLRSVHEAQADVQEFAHSPLDQVQEWSGLPWRTRLFESLLVFQHDDAEVATRAWLGDGIATDLVHVPTQTAYPLSVIVAGMAVIELRVTFDARYFTAGSAREMANGLRDALAAIVSAPAGATVADVLARLPEPTIASRVAVRTGEFLASRSALEGVLAGLWGEVLGIDRVGVTDDFFALGGYSLVATQIASRARATLQVDVPVRLLFQHPTVAGLAEALQSRERKPGQLERIAQLVQRVNSMSLDEVRHARAARAGIN